VGLEKAVECIRKNKSFLVTSHTHLEGDALGAELAFYRLLRAMGKSAVIVNNDPVPLRYEFLPGVNTIKKYNRQVKNIKFDCFAILDCSDLNRCGQVSSINASGKPILNIDHHISNVRFGRVNWVESKASSCSELVFKLFKKLRIPFNKETALLLYVGILTDTGSFRYTNTTSFAHQAAAELIKHKIPVNKIYKHIYENMNTGEFGVLTKILPKIKFICDGRASWFKVDNGLLKDRVISLDITESVLNFARAIKGVEVAAAFRRNLGAKDEVRVNLRSTGKIDVNKIAKFFGGGGHRAASGCTIKGPVKSAIKKVLSKIEAIFS